VRGAPVVAWDIGVSVREAGFLFPSIRGHCWRGHGGCRGRGTAAAPSRAGAPGVPPPVPGTGWATSGVLTGPAADASHRSCGLSPGSDVFAVPGGPIYPPVTAPQFKIDWWQLA
jgi:hypothetical protein